MTNGIYEMQSAPDSAVWATKWRYDEAEEQLYSVKTECPSEDVVLDVSEDAMVGGAEPEQIISAVTTATALEATATPQLGLLASQIAKVRQDIRKSLEGVQRPIGGAVSSDVINRVSKLEGENTTLKKSVTSLERTVAELTARLSALEDSFVSVAVSSKKTISVQDDEDEEEVDLFGSDEDEEDSAVARVREERLKQYAMKKSTKPGPIAKSSVLLDCKPWDDETDLKAMEAAIREIKLDGLNWGAAKAVPLAYGIHKLSILTIVEDEKVSIDDLTERIESIDEYVQSVDIAAFNKI